MKLDFDKFIVKPGSKVNLKDYDTGFTAGLKKKKGVKELQNNIEELAVLQEKFWADNT